MSDVEAGTADEPAPDAAAAPVDDPVAAAVVAKFPGSVAVESHGQSVVHVDRGALHAVTGYLRDHERFTQCSDVTAVDHAADLERVAVPGVTPERSMAAFAAATPRSVADRSFSAPPNDPKGVRAPPRKTISLFIPGQSSHCFIVTRIPDRCGGR